MATYFITGVAGFIGSNVARSLVELGENVHGIDNFATGHRRNIASILDKISFTEGTITDEDVLRRAMADADYCLHFAGINSVPRSIDKPIAVNEANVDGSIKVFLAARDLGLKRVIAASSSSVCGTRETRASTEQYPHAPISPYSVSKTALENYARVFSDLYDIDIAVFRYFNVFGPQQDPDSPYSAVIPLFIKKLLTGEVPTIHGDGSQSRDFTYVENIVHANVLGCAAEGRLSGVYNIACGATTSVLELTRILMELTNVAGDPQFTSPRAGDIRFSLADVTKAKEAFGYVPKVTLQEGLERTVAWFRSAAMT